MIDCDEEQILSAITVHTNYLYKQLAPDVLVG